MNNTKINPLHDNIIVQQRETIMESAGGIVLPGAVDERPAEAVVIAVGKGIQMANGDIDAPSVAVGDIILFGQKAGIEITVDDEDFFVLTEDEIIAIID